MKNKKPFDVIYAIDISLLNDKLWKNFIKMLFNVSDSFSVLTKNSRTGKVEELVKYERELNCDNYSHRAISHMKVGHAHYPKMYPCAKETESFFLQYNGYTDFEEVFEDLVFFRNRRITYVSISHEDQYEFDLPEEIVLEYADKYNLLDCIRRIEFYWR